MMAGCDAMQRRRAGVVLCASRRQDGCRWCYQDDGEREASGESGRHGGM
jgi:hypothetical protein